MMQLNHYICLSQIENKTLTVSQKQQLIITVRCERSNQRLAENVAKAAMKYLPTISIITLNGRNLKPRAWPVITYLAMPSFIFQYLTLIINNIDFDRWLPCSYHFHMPVQAVRLQQRLSQVRRCNFKVVVTVGS